MKIYTQEIDIALQSPKRFWVAPFSDFKIGVKIVKNGVPVENQFNVFNGDVELTPDQGLTNGFTTFTVKSNETGSVEYKVVVAGVGETFKITQIVTDSTVFEIDASGGGGVPSDVATQSWVENYVTAQTSAFIDETALAPYAKTSDIASTYATKVELSDYATTSEMTSAISAATTDMATKTWVGQQDYATAGATTSAIRDATSNKVTGSAIGSAPVVTNAVAVYASVWASMSASANANTLYVVLSDPS